MGKLISRKNQKLLVAAIIVLLLTALKQTGYMQPLLETAEQNQPGLYPVIEVVDGDTITVDMAGSKETVRLIGVDTPETKDPRKAVQCFGKAASQFTRNLIGNNPVRLEADPVNTNRDRYNRLLRYVYLADGTFVNAEIIKQGYGFAYVNFPFSRIEPFKEYQADARAKGQGLWSSCPVIEKDNGQLTTGNE